jgi:hypothetical protein
MLGQDSIDRCAGIWRDCELGDTRISRRAAAVAEAIARRPTAPLPMALETDAAVQGAYRLVNNRRVTFELLAQVLAEIARQRGEEADDVLVLHDTTDCSFPHLDPAEVGYLNTGKAGFRLHGSLVVDASGWRRPVGMANAEIIARPKRRRAKGKQSGAATSRWKDKEYERWWRGIEASERLLSGCKRVIHVADRESDSYELMQSTVALGGHFVFRVRIDRRGRNPGDAAWSKLSTIRKQLDGVVEREVQLSVRKASTAPRNADAHPPRQSRSAKLRFSATAIELPRPRNVDSSVPETLALNMIQVTEAEPPPGEKPVDWLLYTTEPIATVADIERVVDIYRVRWLSEEFHAALKGGCAFDSRGFESRHALLNMLALSIPIAIEALALRSAARDSEQLAEDVLTPEQLVTLRKISRVPLSARPTAKEALLAVAKLGGHLKRNGPPGWRIMSRGMSELQMHEAIQARALAAAEM